MQRLDRLRLCPDLSEGRVTVILCARPRGGMSGADDEGTGLAGAEDGVGNLCSPGTHADGHGRSKAEGQHGGRNELTGPLRTLTAEWLAKGVVKVEVEAAGPPPPGLLDRELFGTPEQRAFLARACAFVRFSATQ